MKSPLIGILVALIAYCALLSACTRQASDINGTYMATVRIGESDKE